jgi:hypothetical protein
MTERHVRLDDWESFLRRLANANLFEVRLDGESPGFERRSPMVTEDLAARETGTDAGPRRGSGIFKADIVASRCSSRQQPMLSKNNQDNAQWSTGEMPNILGCWLWTGLTLGRDAIEH